MDKTFFQKEIMTEMCKRNYFLVVREEAGRGKVESLPKLMNNRFLRMTLELAFLYIFL